MNVPCKTDRWTEISPTERYIEGSPKDDPDSHRLSPLVRSSGFGRWINRPRKLALVAILAAAAFNLAAISVLAVIIAAPSKPRTFTMSDDHFFCGMLAVMESDIKGAVKLAEEGYPVLARTALEQAERAHQSLHGWDGATRCWTASTTAPAAFIPLRSYEWQNNGRVIFRSTAETGTTTTDYLTGYSGNPRTIAKGDNERSGGLQLWSNPGDTVLSGSGTTALSTSEKCPWHVTCNSIHCICLGKRTMVADTNKTTDLDDQVIAYTSITAARTVTIDMDGVNSERVLMIKDESGSASGTNSITVKTSRGDIAGVVGSLGITCVNSAFGSCKVVCGPDRCSSLMR